jgi:hypothetical protein
MLEDQFREIWRNRNLRYKIKSVIDFVIPKVDFSKVTKYELIDGVVYDKIFGELRWSWMNSINTNYSSIYKLIDEINQTSSNCLLYDDFINNTDKTVELFKNKLLEKKQEFFTPGSKVFKKMFFITQTTWNLGIISVISGIYTISKTFNLENFNLDFKRGSDDDMNKGCDLLLYFDGKKNVTQHKVAKLYDKDTHFISTDFIYNELSYRNSLDLISIDTKDEIYLFKNSNEKHLCGTNERGNFVIYKTLLISPPMNKENEELTDLLLKLNQVCGSKNIIFEFEKNESMKNYFEDVVSDNVRTLRLFLNDLEDKELVNKIKNQLDNLK